MAICKMSHFNAWANPSKAGHADAVQMAAFLEARSCLPDVFEVNQRLCDVVAPQPGERLLEVGSGSGALCRLPAAHARSAGWVIGVDISPEMTSEAGRYARSAGIEAGIFFETGAAETLPHADASFDAAIAARLLLHAAEPDEAIREMRRVVKPGGRLVVMDWDFDTVTVDHPDRDLTRRLLHWRSDHHGGNNWSGRQLWSRMHSAGLQNLSVHPWVSVACSEEDGLTQSLWRAAQVACQAGAISPAESDAWIGELKERLRKGSFFASVAYFIVKGFVASHPGRGN